MIPCCSTFPEMNPSPLNDTMLVHRLGGVMTCLRVWPGSTVLPMEDLKGPPAVVGLEAHMTCQSPNMSWLVRGDLMQNFSKAATCCSVS